MSDRPYLLERVDEAAVVQLYADGFTDLTRRDRVLAYHLSRAALAGRDIYYDQRYEPSLAMRAVLEALVRHPAAIPPDTFSRIQHYTKLFWLNSGPHNNLTARKFILRCEPKAFDEAVRSAAGAGATMPRRAGESFDDMLARLRPLFFDPAVDPLVTCKNPGPGQDVLTASANNLYVGVALPDLKGLDERYASNSRLVRQNGQLVEEVYRVGGRYGQPIARIIAHLEQAIPHAPDPTAAALRALVRYYTTGEAVDREAYDIAWVSDRDATVDTINGFTEVYLDARGIKAAWESAVFFVNPHKTRAIQALASHAAWFEAHLPVDAAYRRETVIGVTARAIDVIVESGDAGPVTPIGINLPNDDRIRAEHGSKSVSMANVMHAYDESLPPSYWTEFSWTRDEAERARRWASLAAEVTTNLHEVIGHASGRTDPRLDVPPQRALQDVYSTIEESRADLVALHFMASPVLSELGVVPAEHHADITRAAYESYARNALVQLRRVREGTQIEEDHMRNRQMIVRWLMAGGHGVHERWRDGRTYYVVTDPQAMHAGVGTLLREVQRIKSQGDYRAARALVDTHGVHFDPVLRDEIVARVQRVDLPSSTGFVMPDVVPVRDAAGTVVDATLRYPLDLTAQMLAYAEDVS